MCAREIGEFFASELLIPNYVRLVDPLKEC